MATLDSLINITISTTPPAAVAQGFGIPLILGSNATFSDRVRTYSNLTAVVADFAANTAEYAAAASAFAQPNPPTSIKIGKRSTPVAEVMTVTVTTVADTTVYTVTINSSVFSFTSAVSATATQIQTGLLAAINAGTEPVTAATSGANAITLTTTTAGLPFSVSTSSNMTTATTTASVGVVDDLTAINAIDSSWYGLILTSRTDADILAAASWIETQQKFFLACSNSAAVLTTATTDVASHLKNLGYLRTGYLWSSSPATFPEAGLFGVMLPKQPGSATFKFKDIAGTAADSLSDTQIANATGKNANVYIPVAGVPVVEEGKTAIGEYIDVVLGRDWMKTNMQTNIYNMLRSNDKIPITDTGITMVTAQIENVLQQAVGFNIITNNPAYTVFQPKAADISSADRAARRITGITWNARLAGAVHFATISGYVSV